MGEGRDDMKGGLNGELSFLSVMGGGVHAAGDDECTDQKSVNR